MAGTTSSPGTSILAVVSLVLGLLAVCPLLVMLLGLPAPLTGLLPVLPLLILAGLPALVLGFVSLRLVNQSDGRLRGQLLAIAGMLLGGLTIVVVPAVGLLANRLLDVREKADRVECQNNLRMIAAAVAEYHDEHKHYPLAILPNPALPADRPDKHLSWLASILPYLERPKPPQPGAPKPTAPRVAKTRETYERLDLTQAWDAAANRPAVTTVLREFLCPGHPHRVASEEPALGDYVGITGLGPDAAALPTTDPRAGFFGYQRQLTRDQLQAARGTSQTLLATETTRENGPWAAGGPATLRSIEAGQAPYGGAGRPFGGLHMRGFNVLYADGSVLFFHDGIDEKVLEALVPIAATTE